MKASADHTAKSTSVTLRGRRGMAGKLANIMFMPIDVFAEVSDAPTNGEYFIDEPPPPPNLHAIVTNHCFSHYLYFLRLLNTFIHEICSMSLEPAKHCALF